LIKVSNIFNGLVGNMFINKKNQIAYYFVDENTLFLGFNTMSLLLVQISLGQLVYKTKWEVPY